MNRTFGEVQVMQPVAALAMRRCRVQGVDALSARTETQHRHAKTRARRRLFLRGVAVLDRLVALGRRTCLGIRALGEGHHPPDVSMVLRPQLEYCVLGRFSFQHTQKHNNT